MYRFGLTLLLVGVVFGSMDHHVEKVSIDICTECEQIVGTIHLVLANNETEGAVLNALHQICTFLPSQFQAACGDVVSHYGLEIIDAMVKYLADPSQLCTMLGLCGSATSDTAQREAFNNFQRLMTVYSNRGVRAFDVPKQLEGMSRCSLCEFLMDLAQTTLSDQPMRDFAKAESLKLCSLLDLVKKEECKLVVYSMEPRVYDAIVKRYLNPMTFCTGVQLCDSDDK